MRGCLALAGALIVMSASTARAGQADLRISHCLDPQLQEREQVLACNWQTQAPTRQGTRASTRWLKLDIATPETEPPHGLALQVRPYFLEKVHLHQLGANGQWQVHEAGDLLPGSQPYAVLGGYAFPLNPRSQPHTVYLEVHASDFKALGLKLHTVWQPHGAPDIGAPLDIGLQLGLLSMVTLFAFISFVLHPQAVMGRFTLLTLVVMSCTLVGSGMAAMTVLQEHPGLSRWFLDALLCVRLSLWVWVSQALLQVYAPPRWWPWFCRATHCLVALSVLLVTLGWTSVMHALLLPLILLAPVVQACAVWQTQRLPPAFKRLIFGGFVVTGVLLLLALGAALLPPQAFQVALLAVRLTDLANPLVLLGLILLQQRWRLAELKKTQDELEQNRIRAEFERRTLAERKVLIDMLVHELKTPLASISLAVGSLLPADQAKAAGPARRLVNIRRSIRDMSIVLDHCALMNALEDGQTPIRPEALDLAELVQAQVHATGQASRFVLHTPPKQIVGDAHLLRLVLANLLDNALKYSPAGTPIDIQVQGEQQVQILIDNRVHEDMRPDLDKLFTRYYRHPLAQQVRGTGLGLFLVRAICDKLGAQVSCLTRPAGVRFVLELAA